MDFNYIKKYYNVPEVLMYQEVIVYGKKGVITKDMGNYIGVNFYENKTYEPIPCHPTSEVEYLGTYNYNPPIKSLTPSQKRYQKYLREDTELSFSEWLGIR